MRPAFAFPLLLALFGLACRQIAGIDEIQPAPAPDAARHDAAPLDAGAHCDCPGCTVLATGLSYPISLVLVGKDLYVTNYGPTPGDGSLVRVPTAGGPVETVLGKLTHPFALTTDGTHLFWLAEDGKGHGLLETRSVSGGAVVDLATGMKPWILLYKGKFAQLPTSSLLALSASDLYFIDSLGSQGPGGVSFVPKTGGTVRSLIPSNLPDAGALTPITTIGIATDNNSLVWIDGNLSFGGIVRAPIPTGPLEVLISNLVSPINLTVSGDKILFSSIGLSGTNGTIQWIPKSGGAPTTLLKGLSFPWTILVDDGFVYASTVGGLKGGQIFKVSLDGGSPITLVDETPQAIALVADNESIYWVDAFCGTVMKSPR